MLHVLCAAIGLLVGLQAPPADKNLSVVVQEISRTGATASGQPIDPPAGAEVITSIYTIAPGAVLPDHKHRFPRYAYVLAGRLQVTNAESGEVFTYEAGAFIVEMIDTWHRGSNIGSEPVRLLVIDQVERGSSNTIVKTP